jgi:hypothetical protein
MNSYLMELLANDRAESWRRQAQRARTWRNAESMGAARYRRTRGSRFSTNGGREATILVDCR